jgi:hypothetical protein
MKILFLLILMTAIVLASRAGAPAKAAKQPIVG